MLKLSPAFKKGFFWVLLGVLVIAISLSAQAPKAPTSNPPTGEVGRYVFWSTPLKGGDYKYGFLDTKKARVWTYERDSMFFTTQWTYQDLNREAVHYLQSFMLEFDKRQFGADTTGFRKKAKETMNEAEKIIEEKEK